MLNVKKILYSMLVSLILLSSCKNIQNSENDSHLNARVKITSEYNKNIEFNVYLENESGQSVNCAVVSVKSSSGVSLILEFDNNIQCYKGSMNGIDNDNYEIKVKSNIIGDTYKIIVPHSRLDSKPVVTNFSDSGGNNVLSGKSLINTNEIQISWDSIKADNVVYQVIIRNSLSVKWLASVKSNYVIIPANSLESGTYYLTINAQNIYGDVLFETYNYYSVSNCSSASISFCIE